LVPVQPATSVLFDIAQGDEDIDIYGASAGDHLGASIAAGVVGTGGVVDLVMGAPDAAGPADSRLGPAEVYVLARGTNLNPSRPPLPGRIDVSLSTMNLTVYGAAPGDHFGSTVAVGRINTVGNTDTIADVLVGAPGALANKGEISVFYGGAALFFFAARDIAIGQDDLEVTGQAAGDELGWAIATGDIDNNGGGDMVLGAPFADVATGSASSRTDAGKVYILLAGAGTIPPVNHNPTVTVTQPNGGETALGGLPFEIHWTASDPDGDNTLDHFDIFLSTDGTAFNTKLNTAGPVAGTARTFTWAVPAGLNTTTAKVRVTAFDNAGGTAQDDSNANFTITDAGIGVT